jgi:hypothetical protein
VQSAKFSFCHRIFQRGKILQANNFPKSPLTTKCVVNGQALRGFEKILCLMPERKSGPLHITGNNDLNLKTQEGFIMNFWTVRNWIWGKAGLPVTAGDIRKEPTLLAVTDKAEREEMERVTTEHEADEAFRVLQAEVEKSNAQEQAMGLDSRIYYVPRDDGGSESQRSPVELQNWRGRDELNDWMMALCLRKGQAAAFSEAVIMKECGFCVALDLTDLEELEALMRAKAWTGFSGYLQGIKQAKAEIRNGNAVFYSADW